MPKLYGELIAENKMRVDIISYSGNKAGGVEVEEVLEGEGTHFVNPLTGEQWYETEIKTDPVKEIRAKMAELQQMLETLTGGGAGELGG